jgi:hypothetical protein
MPRWLLFGGIGFVFVCILCCALTFVVGLPRLRDGFEESVRDAVATEVAAQLPGTPGTTTITAESLQASLRQSADDDDIIVVITPSGLELGVSNRGQEVTYTGLPIAVNGRFEMQNMDSNSSVLDFFLSPDDMGNAIEEAVNGYLAANGLRLESVELIDGAMILTTVAA